MNNNDFLPIEQKLVPFNGAELLGVRANDGKVYVGVRWVCEGIGLTEDQMKNERKKIQSDLVLRQGGSNFTLPTNGGRQEVLTIDIDFLPLWLAKISITPSMQAHQPEVADKLVKYQLKARDVLAAAFIHNGFNYNDLSPELKAIFAADKKMQQFDHRLNRIENNTTIDYGQQRRLTQQANEVVVSTLGGVDSPAYRNRSLRSKTYSALWRDFKDYFETNSMRDTLVKDFDKALDRVAGWHPQGRLLREIENTNRQMAL